MPPSLERLRQRLESRETETPESIERRMKKAPSEIEKASDFDKLILNDNLHDAFKRAENLVRDFLKNKHSNG